VPGLRSHRDLHSIPTRRSSDLHHAVDDHSRVAYSEILDDERKETAAEFMQRAIEFFKQHGVTVAAVMTDNGACYRSHVFNNVLRSEEHTSELQSRENLVCRLLL